MSDKIDQWMGECVEHISEADGLDHTFRSRIIMCWYMVEDRLRGGMKQILLGKHTLPAEQAAINEVWDELEKERANSI
jgi:hypothetical protein